MGPLFFPVVLIAACFDELAQRLQFGHVFDKAFSSPINLAYDDGAH